MKKKALIELLESIPGNPDVVMWNGYVGDFNNISKNIVESELVKLSLEHITERMMYSEMRERKTWELPEDVVEKIKKEALLAFKEEQYELPNQFLDDKQYKSWYGKNRKKVLIISPKLRGKSTFDRLGDIDY